MFIYAAKCQHDMRVRISVTLIMKCPVCDHAFRYEIIFDKASYAFDLLFTCHFIRESDLDLAGELCIGSLLDLLHFVPEHFAVLVPLWRVRRKDDLVLYHSAFTREVVRYTGLVVIQLLAGPVCSRSYSGSAARTTDDLYRAMVY